MYRIVTFIRSLFWHICSGFPKSSQELIEVRYAICNGCDSFDRINHQCVECGCNINTKKVFMNKLAWADQKCPLNKW